MHYKEFFHIVFFHIVKWKKVENISAVADGVEENPDWLISYCSLEECNL